MMRFAREAAHWAGRHAFPAAAATVIAIGAAGGGIGYVVASQHTPATAAAVGTSPPTTAAPALKGRGGAATRAGALVQHALAMLAAQTGQSVAAVRSQLAAGRSIDEIAGSKAPAIESEILAAITKLADHAVTSGRITAAQEASDLALARTKVAALMAEPGTQLIKDARNALKFLKTRGHRGPAAPTASPSPGA
jgi:hypothetical protein